MLETLVLMDPLACLVKMVFLDLREALGFLDPLETRVLMDSLDQRENLDFQVWKGH